MAAKLQEAQFARFEDAGEGGDPVAGALPTFSVALPAGARAQPAKSFARGASALRAPVSAFL